MTDTCDVTMHTDQAERDEIRQNRPVTRSCGVRVTLIFEDRILTKMYRLKQGISSVRYPESRVPSKTLLQEQV